MSTPAGGQTGDVAAAGGMASLDVFRGITIAGMILVNNLVLLWLGVAAVLYRRRIFVKV